MKIAIVKPVMTDTRFHFDRSLELSKYFDIVWICGSMLYDNYSFDDFQAENHRIEVVHKDKMRSKFKGVWDEFKVILKSIKQIKKEAPDVVIVHSSRLAILYPILHKGCNYFLELFTTSVSTSKLNNLIWDTWGEISMMPYNNFIVDTPKMVDSFNIGNNKKAYVFEWGMKPISRKPKYFNKIKLLYIGVLGPSRRIEDTIKGLRLFLDENPGTIVSYDIIGKAKSDQAQLIRNAIANNNLNDIVAFHGYLPDNDIMRYFDECNVGVSYVPITPYYTDVTVTKTMEYLLSGMPVIATGTKWHKMYIDETNGVLIQDSPESFAGGLQEVLENLQNYNSNEVMESGNVWNLETNVMNKIVPLLKSIIGEKKRKN